MLQWSLLGPSEAVLMKTHKTYYSWEQNLPLCSLMGEVNLAIMYVIYTEGKQHTGRGSSGDHTCSQ